MARKREQQSSSLICCSGLHACILSQCTLHMNRAPVRQMVSGFTETPWPRCQVGGHMRHQDKLCHYSLHAFHGACAGGPSSARRCPAGPTNSAHRGGAMRWDSFAKHL